MDNKKIFRRLKESGYNSAYPPVKASIMQAVRSSGVGWPEANAGICAAEFVIIKKLNNKSPTLSLENKGTVWWPTIREAYAHYVAEELGGVEPTDLAGSASQSQSQSQLSQASQQNTPDAALSAKSRRSSHSSAAPAASSVPVGNPAPARRPERRGRAAKRSREAASGSDDGSSASQQTTPDKQGSSRSRGNSVSSAASSSHSTATPMSAPKGRRGAKRAKEAAASLEDSPFDDTLSNLKTLEKELASVKAKHRADAKLQTGWAAEHGHGAKGVALELLAKSASANDLDDFFDTDDEGDGEKATLPEEAEPVERKYTPKVSLKRSLVEESDDGEGASVGLGLEDGSLGGSRVGSGGGGRAEEDDSSAEPVFADPLDAWARTALIGADGSFSLCSTAAAAAARTNVYISGSLLLYFDAMW
jgi:hypothetical protein